MTDNITNIYDEYFQKSRVFLYPSLDIKRGVSITPIETYISWKDNIDISDNELICLYHLKDDKDFLNFEEKYLLNNKYFKNYHQVSLKKGIYTFKINPNDWKYFLAGRYSKLSKNLKDKILKFYGNKSINSLYVKSYLYPEMYFKKYSEILKVNENLIRKVAELCDRPNFKNEELILIPEFLKLEDI